MWSEQVREKIVSVGNNPYVTSYPARRR